jgi:hypothetical protein
MTWRLPASNYGRTCLLLGVVIVSVVQLVVIYALGTREAWNFITWKQAAQPLGLEDVRPNGAPTRARPPNRAPVHLVPNCTEQGHIKDMSTRLRRYHLPGLPKLRDAFADGEYFYGVFNVRFLKKGQNVRWVENSPWKCIFPVLDGPPVVSPSTTEGRDSHYHSWVVRCEIPRNHTNVVSIEGILTGANGTSEEVAMYEDVPICVLPPPPGEPALAMMCTQLQTGYLRGRELDFWIGWHKYMGISHVLIYANEDPTNLNKIVAQSPYKEMIEVIDFNHPFFLHPKDFGDQIVQLNSCLYRAKNRRFKWLFSSDPDEFFFPVLDGSLEGILKRLTPEQASTPGLLICNNWHRAQDASIAAEYNRTGDPSLLRIASDKCKTRGKCFFQPDMVQFISVHTLTSSQQVYSVPESIAYLVHTAWKAEDDETPIFKPLWSEKSRAIFQWLPSLSEGLGNLNS